MIDFPINEVVTNFEHLAKDERQSKTQDAYELLEIDLSFSNALASCCSGEASSGPINRPTTHASCK